jgi:hypothetical protein
MGIATRVMLVVAAGLLVVGGVLATQHVYERGYDCGNAFAVNDPSYGHSEATVFGGANNSIDCTPRIRDRRALAGGLGAAAVLLAAAAILAAGNFGSTSTPRREQEVLRLNG